MLLARHRPPHLPLNSPLSQRERVALGVVVVVSATATFVGWRAFWFLCDDAFIAFRYASNLMAGRGLTWNPAPFAPVEGYTSFLWTVLLAGVWKLFGVEPPDSANVLSLLFGYGTLWLVGRAMLRAAWPESVRPYRVGVLALVLLGTVTNRTFLAFLSSGLETSLFNFCVTAWVVVAMERNRGTMWALWLCAAAALMALVRPDGLLFVASTVAMLSAQVFVLRERVRLAQCLPLLAVPAHVLWRKATYDAWLPNTYFAKSVGAWPEAGLRYLASFSLEYGVWFWALILGAWAWRRWGAMRATARAPFGALLPALIPAAAVLTASTRRPVREVTPVDVRS